MSSDFILCMRTVLQQGFRLFTSFNLPGVNFSPAVLMFGILSFGLAIIFIKGIISISAEGINYTAYQQNVVGRQIRNSQSRSVSNRQSSSYKARNPYG